MTLAQCCCRANAQQPKLFVGMILILIFAEALALYGLIGEWWRVVLLVLCAAHTCVEHYARACLPSALQGMPCAQFEWLTAPCTRLPLLPCSWHHPVIQGWQRSSRVSSHLAANNNSSSSR